MGISLCRLLNPSGTEFAHPKILGARYLAGQDSAVAAPFAGVGWLPVLVPTTEDGSPEPRNERSSNEAITPELELVAAGCAEAGCRAARGRRVRTVFAGGAEAACWWLLTGSRDDESTTDLQSNSGAAEAAGTLLGVVDGGQGLQRVGPKIAHSRMGVVVVVDGVSQSPMERQSFAGRVLLSSVQI
ncbi:hypothetical protein DM860_017967 [Cuscuta australis]|uniref:Uncharacterized protein n=1 Tax=Cuscuta australis TaxID=267555 RepID=A0A328DWE2_9ASTE|nr:hypothetical protein DM860_017967 [Cuscuta australis]